MKFCIDVPLPLSSFFGRLSQMEVDLRNTGLLGKDPHLQVERYELWYSLTVKGDDEG